MTDTDVNQLTLVPDTPPVILDDLLPVAELPDGDALVGPAPDKELVESIRRYGVLEPLLVQADDTAGKIYDGHSGYTIIDGRRRLKAARLAGLVDVPARVVVPRDREHEAWMPNVLTIAAHATRRDNPASDVEAIRSLVEQGADEQLIRQATGLSAQTIRKRSLLLDLPQALLDALAEGRMAVSVAERAAKLPAERQAELAAILSENGKLTGRDVEAVRQVEREAAVAALPFDQMAEMPTADDVQPADPGLDAAIRKIVDAYNAGLDPDAMYGLVHDLVRVAERREMAGVS